MPGSAWNSRPVANVNGSPPAGVSGSISMNGSLPSATGFSPLGGDCAGTSEQQKILDAAECQFLESISDGGSRIVAPIVCQNECRPSVGHPGGQFGQAGVGRIGDDECVNRRRDARTK